MYLEGHKYFHSYVKKRSSDISIQFNNSLNPNDSEITNLLNIHFSPVGIELQQKIPKPGNPLSYFDAISRQTNSFRFFDRSAGEIEILLSKSPNTG